MVNIIVDKSITIKIKPTKEQIKYFNQCFGIRRFAWNWCLNKMKEQDQVNGSTKNYKPEVDFNANREQYFPFVLDVNCKVYKYAIEDLETAWYDTSKGTPKYKSKNNEVKSFRCNIATHNNLARITDNTVTIQVNHSRSYRTAKYTSITTTENLCFLKDKKITRFTILYHNGEYFVSFSYKDKIEQYNEHKYDKIGIDLGIKTFATQSDSVCSYLPKQIKILEQKISDTQRILSLKEKNSKNYFRIKKRLWKLNNKLVNIRKDFLDKYTTWLCKTYKEIHIEDLKVSNMLKNHKLARSINRNCFYTFRSMLEYKSKWYNCKLIIVDTWYPSSKTCSKCGNKKNDLKLSDRIYKCENCGLEMDRDLNAAINLMNHN